MVKASTSPQAIFEHARIVREMAGWVERFLAGAITREDLLTWALSASLDGKGIRFHNPRAAILYGCLCGLDDRLEKTQEHIIRRSDLAVHLHELRSGQRPFPREPPPVVAMVKLSAEEIAQRTGATVARFFWEGLGWYESVCFTSAGAGTGFFAMSPLVASHRSEPSAAVCAWGTAESTAERTWLLTVLFDALCIDAAEATSLWAPLAAGWDLMRQDDNGNKFLVASFTGYAKARARIEQFDAMQHKQLYWLEERALAGNAA